MIQKGFIHTILICALVFTAIGQTPAAIAAPTRAPAAVVKALQESRKTHAREVLGSHYSKSVVRYGENIPKVRDFVQTLAEERLPQEHKAQAARISRAIMTASLEYGFDPLFLYAVIDNESRFNPTTIGSAGEIGLMQLLPKTAAWVAKKAKLPWRGEESLKDPVTNIRLGSYYLSYLRGKFDSHARLYLSAYNMGARNVKDLLKEKIWPKEYVMHVMGFYVAAYRELKERKLDATSPAKPAAREVASLAKAR